MEEVINEIINEIIKIDTVALDAKQKNEGSLEIRKQKYEEEIKNYKKSVLDAAEKKAKELYDQIVGIGNQEYILEEERAKKEGVLLENHYLQVETALLEEIFDTLFIVEG